MAGQHDESGGSGSGYDDISEDEDVNSSDGTNHRRFGFGQIRKFSNFPRRIFGRFGDSSDSSDSSLVADGSVNLVVNLANAVSCVFCFFL